MSYGSVRLAATCSKCGTETEFQYEWDDECNYRTVMDTEHAAPDGTECKLDDSDIDRAIDHSNWYGPEYEND